MVLVFVLFFIVVFGLPVATLIGGLLWAIDFRKRGHIKDFIIAIVCMSFPVVSTMFSEGRLPGAILFVQVLYWLHSFILIILFSSLMKKES